MSDLVWYKDKDEDLDFPLTWEDWLPAGDTILVSIWAVPAGITKLNDQLASPIVIIWLSGGGSSGTRHVLQNKITTAQGRITERTITVIMTEK